MNAFDHTDLIIDYGADRRAYLLEEAATERLLPKIHVHQRMRQLFQSVLTSVGSTLLNNFQQR